MDEALMKELEELREENKILRDSLVEYVPEDENGDEDSADSALQAIAGTLTAAIEQVREGLRPGSEKVTEFLSHQMEENPVPLLLAAFGAGFLVGKKLDSRKDVSDG
ncbi:MAG: hypothetical protein FWF83_01390 [Clostridiales bacterium]|nr:hypothetical protein [Clostridiales bacterium]